MHIIVCIKQVPDSQNVKVDPVTGTLIRSSVDSKMNPFDLFAIETAVRIKARTNARITAVSMGPNAALAVLEEALSMGVDEACLLSDRRFGGADVLATSYTIAAGIKHLNEPYDLIICGRQTTDGDTAQVGPSIAENLGIPHISWCSEIVEATDKEITVRQNLSESVLTLKMAYPCLITVEKDIFQPRLPSYLLKEKARSVKPKIVTYDDLRGVDPTRFGSSGSATQVEKIFEPDNAVEAESFTGSGKENAEKMLEVLKKHRFVEVE